MACIRPDGKLTESAKIVLKILADPMTPNELAGRLSMPLFQIRASLRELTNAGLLGQDDDRYVITDEGKKSL